MDDDEVFPFDGARYCPTPACDVVYFHAEAGVVRVESVRVRVGQKESAPDRPVCYCFGFSAADIVANPEAVRRDITERCRRGRDRCREANPQGACCLGQVRAIALAAPPSSDPAER
jgi:hypothetical protein